MSRAGKIATAAALMAAVTVVGWVMLVGVLYAAGGVVTVEVEDRHQGLDIYLPVPMVLLDAMVASAAMPAVHTAGLPRVELDGMSVDFGELGSVVLELLHELEELPDATLVEVVSGPDRVRISKDGTKLRVEVEEPGTSIDLAIPTRGVLRMAERILG